MTCSDCEALELGGMSRPLHSCHGCALVRCRSSEPDQNAWASRRYTDGGFIVNDITLQGGLLCLRNGFYSWDPDTLDFSAFALLNPLPGGYPVRLMYADTVAIAVWCPPGTSGCEYPHLCTCK